MAAIPNYPIQDGHRTYFVRYPVQITKALLEKIKEQGYPCANYLKPGQWVCADVTQSGYNIPPLTVGNDSKEYAQKACEAHNKYVAGSIEAANLVINASMDNAREERAEIEDAE